MLSCKKAENSNYRNGGNNKTEKNSEQLVIISGLSKIFLCLGWWGEFWVVISLSESKTLLKSSRELYIFRSQNHFRSVQIWEGTPNSQFHKDMDPWKCFSKLFQISRLLKSIIVLLHRASTSTHNPATSNYLPKNMTQN